MRIWSLCIRKKHKQKSGECIFDPLINIGFHYTCEDLYLGQKGILIFPNGNLIVHIEYTHRDGIMANLKKLKPWKVLFNYSDGGYYINIEQDNELYQVFFTYINELEKLRQKIQGVHKLDVFAEIEKLTLNLIGREDKLIGME